MIDLSWVKNVATGFCAKSRDNTLGPPLNEPSWGAPLIGVAAGDDPYFQRFKEDIGDFFWTPLEVFRRVYPDHLAGAADLRVISFVLPQTEETRADQRQEETLPAERWIRSRHYGEIFNEKLREHLVTELQQADIAAVAPARQPDFAYRQSERFGLASNWSERHVAFVAGLGTFGLSDGLITPLGKAVRIGSVVAALDLPITERPYGDDIHAYCLHHAKGVCRACAGRCPANVIGLGGHDKGGCFSYIRNVTARHAREVHGIDATPCGLCQVRIPCESGIPPLLAKAFRQQSRTEKS